MDYLNYGYQRREYRVDGERGRRKIKGTCHKTDLSTHGSVEILDRQRPEGKQKSNS